MKIICIGRNYAQHIEELDNGILRSEGSETACDGGRAACADNGSRSEEAKTACDALRSGGERMPAEPIFFLKPDTALLRNNDPFYIPHFSEQVDYECELVVKINRVGKCIDRRFAHRYYDEVGLGIDFTARDLQRRAAAAGLPWELSKCFDRSAALSPEFVPLSELGGIGGLHFELLVDGQVRQHGCTGEMLFDVDTIISYVSQFMTLRTGDLIYTGTPQGVGAVRAGNNLKAVLEGRTLLDFDIR